jgi:hypothetical protein
VQVGAEASRRTYAVAPEASAIVIRARSSVGPIDFVTTALTGSIDVDVGADGTVRAEGAGGHLTVLLTNLGSGNDLYDAELLRRIDARRFPRAVLDLAGATRIEGTDRFRLMARLTFHGATRDIEGTVEARFDDELVVVHGEQVFDVRDFDVTVPTMVMLKIFPDVVVALHVEARREPAG